MYWLIGGAVLASIGLWIWWNIGTTEIEDEPWPKWLPRDEEED